MSKKTTPQEVADYFTTQFVMALHLASDPHDFQVFLNLIEAIKKALTADMIDETRGETLQALYEKFVLENTDKTAADLESMGELCR